MCCAAGCLSDWSNRQSSSLESPPTRSSSKRLWRTSLWPTTTRNGSSPNAERSTLSSTLSSSSDVRRTLRRLKPSERRASLQYRQRSELPYIADVSTVPKILLDTTVYIDELQGKLPRDVELAIRSTSLWHSTVTECEL